MLFNEYTIIDTISKGNFGANYKASKVGSQDFFLIKEIKKASMLNLSGTIEILKNINHPNILKFIDSKEDPDKIYIIFEYCNGGSLEQYLMEKQKPFSEEEVQYIVKQVVEALKYLNEKGIVHRDLVISNLLINYESEEDLNQKNILKAKIKLADFSLSTYLEKGKLLDQAVGNVKYIPPEILKHQSYDETIDIWSLGVVCSLLLANSYPYENKALLHDNDVNYFLPETLSKEAVSFINCIFQYDPKLRKKAPLLMKHKFLCKNVKEFNKINIEDIKEHIEDSKIKINIKDNQWVSKYFGSGIDE